MRASSLPLAPYVINAASFGLVDHIELRTHAVDEAAHAAIDAGARQLVTLGAGLDARAWRMDGLSEVTVFEVDHPATQSYKRARVASLQSRAREVHFVPIDFERQSLDDVLAAAGHDPAVRTAWIWEGVTPYLGIEAVRSTASTVARRSASGSRLAVSYATPQVVQAPLAIVRPALMGLRLIGEPMVGRIATDAMHAELRAVGFSVLHDTAPSQWAATYGGRRKRILLINERLAVAQR
jgi:methyltransferase (TIGR00027 family)